MTRLVRLELSGFRAFPGPVSLNLDSDVVLLTGPNGSGKTSVFDGVLWALCGRIGRIQGRGDGVDVISLYSDSGVARAVLTLRGDDGDNWRVVRSTDSGATSTLSLARAGETYEGLAAQTKILEVLWPDALLADDSDQAFETSLTRGVYLQQDLVRQFLESDTDEARFEMVGELVGAGRITEFLRQLDSARNAWTRARGLIESDRARVDQQVGQLASRLDRLQSETVDESAQARWNQWWRQVVDYLGIEEDPRLATQVWPQGISQALEELQVRRQQAMRRRVLVQSVVNELDAVARIEAVEAALEQARQEASALAGALADARQQLEQAQREASETRRRLTVQRERIEELKALATLALRHLDDTCPVCAQIHDVDTTRARLTELVSRDHELAIAEFPVVEDLARRVRDLETRWAFASRSAAETEAGLASLVTRREAAIAAFTELGLNREEVDDRDLLVQLLRSVESDIEQIAVLYREGEQLSLSAARLEEVAQRADTEREYRDALTRQQVLKNRLRLHNNVRDVAQRIAEAARNASQRIVEQQVESIEPLVRRIYARIDPHPGFKEVRLLTAYFRGKGRIRTRVFDPTASFPEQDPFPIFSSSQLNALAVSVFLGLNLGVPAVPLDVAMLDDPLQSLDDVNLLGLVDTLRRTRAHRQIVISTHDPRFARLLMRKLRPVGDSERTALIQFKTWSPQGPVFSQTRLRQDLPSVRVVAA